MTTSTLTAAVKGAMQSYLDMKLGRATYLSAHLPKSLPDSLSFKPRIITISADQAPVIRFIPVNGNTINIIELDGQSVDIKDVIVTGVSFGSLRYYLIRFLAEYFKVYHFDKPAGLPPQEFNPEDLLNYK